MQASGWPSAQGTNEAEWEIFEKEASASWFAYEGGDRLLELRTSIGNSLAGWTTSDSLFGKFASRPLDAKAEVATHPLDCLIWCVKTLKAFAKNAGSASGLKRYARSRKKAFDSLQDPL